MYQNYKYLQNLLDRPGPTVGYLGTIDSNNHACSTFVFAFGVSEEPFRVTAYMPEAVIVNVRQHLERHDYAALLIVDGNSFEGVQVKGPTIIKPGDEKGAAFLETNIERLGAFYNSDMFEKVPRHPLIAVELTVKEIYNQTPGQGAGEPLKPEKGDESA